MAKVELVYPRLTRAISVTGPECEANCAHCGGYYLRRMATPEQALEENGTAGYNSFLVSGGSDLEGKIPYQEQIPNLRPLSRAGRINIHPGLVRDPQEAARLGEVAAVASLDLVLDPAVIEHVYGFAATPGDYTLTYRLLSRYLKVVPHLCLGLPGSDPRREEEALEFMRCQGLEAACFLVFAPTRGTRFADCPPPDLDRVERVFRRARELLPGASLHLGCVRPSGRYRTRLDHLAWTVGFDKIVQPAPSVRKMARKQDKRVGWSEECCSF